MLAITDHAAEAIKSLTTDAELPDGGGLRIAAPRSDQGHSDQAPPDQGLELSLAGQPDADDVVLSGDGVAVFLEPVAAQVLDDKVLDVQPVPGADGEEELRFAIGPQQPPGV